MSDLQLRTVLNIDLMCFHVGAPSATGNMWLFRDSKIYEFDAVSLLFQNGLKHAFEK